MPRAGRSNEARPPTERLRTDDPKMDTDEFAKVIRAVATFHETGIDFSAITVRTLVLYGEHEPSFLRRPAPKLGSPNPAPVRVVPDAGHASNLENAEFFTDVVREFLTQVYPSPSEAVHDDAEPRTPSEYRIGLLGRAIRRLIPWRSPPVPGQAVPEVNGLVRTRRWENVLAIERTTLASVLRWDSTYEIEETLIIFQC